MAREAAAAAQYVSLLRSRNAAAATFGATGTGTGTGGLNVGRWHNISEQWLPRVSVRGDDAGRRLGHIDDVLERHAATAQLLQRQDKSDSDSEAEWELQCDSGQAQPAAS